MAHEHLPAVVPGGLPAARLAEYRGWIASGVVTDLRAAYAADRAHYRKVMAEPCRSARFVCRVGGGRRRVICTSARPTEPLVRFSRKRLSMGVALLAVVFAHAGNQLHVDGN